jgi:hypothetical protein
MTAKPVNPHKVAFSPQWVFRWKPLGSPLVPKLVALAISATALVLLVTQVRIQLALPERMSPRRAALIYLGDDPQGRELAMRAREGGPFPSRFEPSDWEGLAALEQQVMAGARHQPEPYVPEIADLPEENLVQALVLAPRGERFFPKREAAAITPPDSSGLKLAPVLHPLSALAAGVLPDELPAFDGPVDGAMAAAPWRFLVRLNADGVVTECTSLEKGGEPAADALQVWLRKVPFKSQPGTPDRWIALGLSFTNQPADGPVAR